SVGQEPLRVWPDEASVAVAERAGCAVCPEANEVPLLIAAYWILSPSGQPKAGGHFNGKIESPQLLCNALTHKELVSSYRTDVRSVKAAQLLASWDFSRHISGTEVADLGPYRLDGHTVNRPTRAVTGHKWTGRVQNWADAPTEYGAIHFHEDDLDD